MTGNEDSYRHRLGSWENIGMNTHLRYVALILGFLTVGISALLWMASDRPGLHPWQITENLVLIAKDGRFVIFNSGTGLAFFFMRLPLWLVMVLGVSMVTLPVIPQRPKPWRGFPIG
jgi:hypothetical protein